MLFRRNNRNGHAKERPRSPESTQKNCPAAIEISSTALKLFQVSATKDGCEIIKADYVPIGGGDVSLESDELKKLVGQFIADNHITGSVVTSLPTDKFFPFTFTLPDMPQEEIYPSITWKLKQNLPPGVAINNVSFEYDFLVSDNEAGSKDIKAMVLAAQKESVLEQIALFRDFSLELTAVEPKSYASLYPLFGANKINPAETVLVLQVGANHSTITIIHSGKPLFTRSLSISGSSLTEAISTYYQFTREKAEEVKIEAGLENDICKPALSSHLENLIVVVEHIFKIFSHQIMKSPHMHFQRIILCGGTAHLKGLDKFIAERLAVPVDVYDIFALPGVIQKQEFGKQLKENSASFASVFGLATRDIYA